MDPIALDALVGAVGTTLRERARAGDVVARLHPMRFAILFDPAAPVPGHAGFAPFRQDIVDVMQRAGGPNVRVDAGLAWFDRVPDDPNEIVRLAEARLDGDRDARRGVIDGSPVP